MWRWCRWSMRGWATAPTWSTLAIIAPWSWMPAGTCARCGRRPRSGTFGWRSPPTPICTPTSSPAPDSLPPVTAPRCWPPRPAAESSGTPGSPTGTRSTSAGCGCAPSARPDTPTSTWRSCCWTGSARLGCSPAGRCWSARRPAPTWSIPNAPRSSPAPSTGPCCGCSPSPTRSRSGRPTARGRSAPPRPARSEPAASAARRPPTRCCAQPTRTDSWRRCWARSAPSRHTSSASPKSTAGARRPPIPGRSAPSIPRRSAHYSPAALRWSTCVRSVTSPPVTFRGLCRSPCAGPSPPGSAGCCHRGSRSSCYATPTRTRTRSSGRRRRSAATTLTPNCSAASRAGPRPGCRFQPSG